MIGTDPAIFFPLAIIDLIATGEGAVGIPYGLSLAEKYFRFPQFAYYLLDDVALSCHFYLSPFPHPNIKIGSAFGTGQSPATILEIYTFAIATLNKPCTSKKGT